MESSTHIWFIFGCEVGSKELMLIGAIKGTTTQAKTLMSARAKEQFGEKPANCQFFEFNKRNISQATLNAQFDQYLSGLGFTPAEKIKFIKGFSCEATRILNRTR